METVHNTKALSLDWWQEIEPSLVDIGKLEEEQELQPRVLRVIPFRDKTTYKTNSAKLIGELEGALRASRSAQLTPLLVAEVDGRFLVVDGHHRLAAYRRAKRKKVPVRVSIMSMRTAIQLSKLANCGQATLQVHNEQKREAAWQWLAHVTDRGAHPYLPNGVTFRDVAGYFGAGVSKSTVQSMLRAVPLVQLSEFREEACDPGTGWPRWKYVRSPKGGYGMGTPEQQQERRKEKAKERAGKFLVDLLATLGPLGVAEVFRELKAEWQDEDLVQAAQAVAEIAAQEEHLERLRGGTGGHLAALEF